MCAPTAGRGRRDDKWRVVTFMRGPLFLFWPISRPLIKVHLSTVETSSFPTSKDGAELPSSQDSGDGTFKICSHARLEYKSGSTQTERGTHEIHVFME